VFSLPVFLCYSTLYLFDYEYYHYISNICYQSLNWSYHHLFTVSVLFKASKQQDTVLRLSIWIKCIPYILLIHCSIELYSFIELWIRFVYRMRSIKQWIAEWQGYIEMNYVPMWHVEHWELRFSAQKHMKKELWWEQSGKYADRHITEKRERGGGDDWVKRCTRIDVESRPGGRPRKTWMKTIEDDMRRGALSPMNAENRSLWKGRNHGTKRPTQPLT
jgi:hypothetical protein